MYTEEPSSVWMQRWLSFFRSDSVDLLRFIWKNMILRSNSAICFQLAQACRILSYLLTLAGLVGLCGLGAG